MESKQSNYFVGTQEKIDSLDSGKFTLNASSFIYVDGLLSNNYTNISNSYSKIGNMVNVTINWTMTLEQNPPADTDKSIVNINLTPLFTKLGRLPKNWSAYNGPILTTSVSTSYDEHSGPYLISSYALSAKNIAGYYLKLYSRLDSEMSSLTQSVFCSMSGTIELSDA